MLLDDSALPAPYRLTQPQELPPFGTDEGEMPSAMIEDRAARRVKKKAAQKPLSIEETRPS